jgi:hypothetical protein
MKALSIAALLACAAAAPTGAFAGQETSSLQEQGAPSLRARLSDDVIRKAVRETLAERPAKGRVEGMPLSGERYEEFSRQFEEARVPGCLRPDGLKRQPTNIGPIGVSGLLALPFVAVAKIRGKCQ